MQFKYNLINNYIRNIYDSLWKDVECFSALMDWNGIFRPGIALFVWAKKS